MAHLGLGTDTNKHSQSLTKSQNTTVSSIVKTTQIKKIEVSEHTIIPEGDKPDEVKFSVHEATQ